MCQRLGCDWSEVVRGAQPLVACHEFSGVDSSGGSGGLSVSAVKAALRARLSPRLLSENLKSHIVTRAEPQNETSVGDRSSFRTVSLW